jgi:hypothetical protein
MWDKQLQQIDEHPIQRYAGGGSKSRRSRLQRFCDWQQAAGYFWYQPALELGLSLTSVQRCVTQPSMVVVKR